MKIFLDEPLIDWQKNAHLQSKNMRPTASSSGPDGTPQSPQQPRMDVDGFAQLQMQVANLKLGMYACLLARAQSWKRSCVFECALNCAGWLAPRHC